MHIGLRQSRGAARPGPAAAQWLCATPLTIVTTTIPAISQAICAMVSRAVSRFYSWGIKSASATYTKLLDATARKYGKKSCNCPTRK